MRIDMKREAEINQRKGPGLADIAIRHLVRPLPGPGLPVQRLADR